MAAKKKERLTPVPTPRKRPAPAAAGKAGRPATGADAGPDLGHITPSLRPLAVSVADVAFMAGNPLQHPPEQIEDLKASLRQFGQVEPLVVNRRPTPPVVVGGNG